jgi:hypothetical protein
MNKPTTPERLPCPCGTERRPEAWRAHSKSYRFRLRCPRCALAAVAASARPEHAIEMWNEAVVAKRDQQRRASHDRRV